MRHPREGGDPEPAARRALLCPSSQRAALAPANRHPRVLLSGIQRLEEHPPQGGFSFAPTLQKAGPSPGASRLPLPLRRRGAGSRSEEHTSELQSLMRISYAVFCLKKKKKHT